MIRIWRDPDRKATGVTCHEVFRETMYAGGQRGRGIARVYKDWGLLQLACFAIQLQQPLTEP